jgi:hypothetical protein
MAGVTMRVNQIPIPSIKANKTAPTTAAVMTARGPARAAKIPPVIPPLAMEFQGSSYKNKIIQS